MKTKTIKQNILLPRPPVVAVLGHVDHGKTTLLDTIRKSNIVAREHGGITQHIGAYQVSSYGGQTITFIDTPGHEAFAKMRSRGANVADVAILVVAADDGVMPQTKESISQIKAAGIPFIVAVNKIDMPAANPDKVKQDLAKNGVQVEGFGGDVPICLISAKENQGIDDLIKLIIKVAGLHGLTNQPDKPLEATVIETRMDKGKGMTSTLIVKSGILKPGMDLYESEMKVANVRVMFNESGVRQDSAGPGKPIEALGFTKFPSIGANLTGLPVVMTTNEIKPEKLKDQIPDFLKPINEGEEQRLNVVLKGDTAGSLEAVTNSLDSRINIVSTGQGDISEADILLAKSCKALVIGFNVKVTPDIEKFAYSEKVIVRSYRIIYELIGELEEVVSGMQDVITTERELGRGTVIAVFPYNEQKVAGTKVISGRLARGDTVRIKREDTEVAVTRIKSMRHVKDEINKAEIGVECGIIFDKKVDFSVGDAIIAFTKI